MERGDGELIFSPQVNNVISLEGPVNTVGAPQALLIDDSFLQSQRLTVTGAAAGSTVTFPTMSRGKWNFQWWAHWIFTGTTNTANQSGFNILDGLGNQAGLIQPEHITGRVIYLSGSMDLTFQRDGFQFQLAVPATVAGDFVAWGVMINARRVV